LFAISLIPPTQKIQVFIAANGFNKLVGFSSPLGLSIPMAFLQKTGGIKLFHIKLACATVISIANMYVFHVDF
jgi:hypothetical protein